VALNPNRHVKFLGQTFVKDFTERPMLVIGEDQWSRAELARMGIVQMKACSIISGIAKQIKSKSVADLYAQTSPHMLADYPCGIVSIYVLLAVFDDRDLSTQEWYKPGAERALVTFETLKHRELKARERERSDAKKRSRSNRRKEHERAVQSVLSQGEK
jgi:hypothetical protein